MTLQPELQTEGGNMSKHLTLSKEAVSSQRESINRFQELAVPLGWVWQNIYPSLTFALTVMLQSMYSSGGMYVVGIQPSQWPQSLSGFCQHWALCRNDAQSEADQAHSEAQWIKLTLWQRHTFICKPRHPALSTTETNSIDRLGSLVSQPGALDQFLHSST